MGLFNFRKNNKNENQQPDPQLQAAIEGFEKEIFEFIPRYVSNAHAEVKIRARHHETGEEIPFAIGFPEPFEAWKETRSLADRRGIIYSLLDDQFGNQLELWQVMERFNDDRYPQRALEIAMEHQQENDLQNPDYWSALARTNLILENYEEAEQSCLKALELDSTSVRAKRIYADVLHCRGKHTQAHQIYQEILTSKLPKDQEMSLPIQKLLGFEGDILNSPIYAASWLKADEKMTPETWDWANEEFYYSPHFRSQYAFYLIEQQEYMKGFVKLLVLSQEMPWFKEGVVNAYNLIDQLNLNDKMQEEKGRLKAIIEANNWS